MPAPPLADLLRLMIKRDATDLYLSAAAPPKFSLHGEFLDADPAILSEADTRSYADEMLNSEQRATFYRDLEINFSYALGDDGRFRVNIFTQRGSVSIVIRRIKMEIPKFADLGLPEKLGELVMQERGLVLMTSPTGSGKSTTLAAMIDYRNERAGGHIITIEDPVEFIHKNKKALVSQRDVGIDTKSFQIALKNTLRQAPKVIYIGEIRDHETMEFALHAGETGHLVLATLHSNNANQTLERIMNFFPHESHQQLLLQLSLNLRAILSQRLIPKKGGGRTAALEVLLNTPFIGELILKGDVTAIKQAMSAGKQEGLQTFDQDLLRLCKGGLISEEDALRFADSPNNLRLALRGITVATTH
ncbi:PilT/PilU family type 4a pilus ATPase [Candidatus Sumerlaeota bacterium]|nr:PilT/PilU family type 4a pilus ATPase [Candidatus Sumerlaeota bacterium]